MKKADDLRQVLARAVPHLKHNPGALHLFIEGGNLVATAAGQNLSFEYQFNLVVLVTDYSGDADAIMVPLLAWVAGNQPELLTNPDKRKTGIRFRAEMLSHDSADIELTLELTERVRVTAVEGGVDVEHLPEPPLDPYQGIDWTLFIQGEQVQSNG